MTHEAMKRDRYVRPHIARMQAERDEQRVRPHLALMRAAMWATFEAPAMHEPLAGLAAAGLAAQGVTP